MDFLTRSHVLFLVGCLVVTGCVQPKPIVTAPTNVQPPTNVVAKPEQLKDPMELDSAVIEKCKKATVLIGNFEGGALTATGSGFVAADGLSVVTNKHVVTGTDDAVDTCKLIFFSGSDKPKLVVVAPSSIRVDEKAKRSDKLYFERDVAVLKLSSKVTDPLTVVADLPLTETEPAWAFGFPVGTNIRMDASELPGPSVHSMRLERIERKGPKVKVIQLGGSPTYGNSGGPVVDAEGKVLGVLQAKVGDATIVYAVPSGSLMSLLKKEDTAKMVAREWLEPLNKPTAEPHKPTMIVGSSKATRARITSSGQSPLAIYDLTASDLSGLSAMTLTILRNEPFARRGYIFHRRELRIAFSNFSWYRGRTNDVGAVRRTFSSREARNVDFIKRYQSANSLDW